MKIKTLGAVLAFLVSTGITQAQSIKHAIPDVARPFEIFVEGQRVGEGVIERYPPGSATGKFYDLDYKIPAEPLKDKQKVTVRFQASGGNETATIFGVRMVRADER